MDRDDGAGPGVRSVLRAYHPPPDGFDPHTAADELLRRHGLPRRPDPGREPSLARAWRRAFARPVTFTGAELAPDPVLSSRVPFGGQGTEFDLNPWAGVVRRKGDEPNYPAPATMVFAQFTVSEVATIDPEGYDPLEVAFWVGLDGYNGLNGQILQAGIAARGEPGLFSNSVSYRAWTEWHPAKAGWMTNFPVTAGDTLSFVACAAEPDFGLVSVLNYATGRATTVGVPAPMTASCPAEAPLNGLSSGSPPTCRTSFRRPSATAPLARCTRSSPWPRAACRSTSRGPRRAAPRSAPTSPHLHRLAHRGGGGVAGLRLTVRVIHADIPEA